MYQLYVSNGAAIWGYAASFFGKGRHRNTD
jgi:hypothetical protein